MVGQIPRIEKEDSVSPDKTGPDGNFRIDLRFKHVGRIRRSLGTRSIREFNQRVALIEKLWKDEKYELLRAFQKGAKRGGIEIEQLIEADKAGQLGSTLSSLTLRSNLWTAIDDTLPKMGNAESTRARYHKAFKALKRKAGAYLGPKATVADLALVPWRDLKAQWQAGPTDWMQMRRGLSRFLTLYMDDLYHPFRRQVMKNVPSAKEQPRKPDVSLPSFRKIVGKAKPQVQPFYWALVLTGMRVGELLSLTVFSLHQDTHTIEIGEGKTPGSSELIRIDARLWGYIKAAVPARYALEYYEKCWRLALRKAGIAKQITLHDLRHCHGQWAIDEGVQESKVQSSLRHESADMTRRYVSRAATREVSKALADVILAKKAKGKKA